jgi:hypothetical protein
MASIRLADYEVEPGVLPQVCVCCGQQADGEARVKFSWHPPWVNILILAGLLPWAIVAAMLTKQMRASLPTCPRHRGHWFNRRLFVYGGLLGMLGLGVVCIAVLASQNGRAADDLVGFLCGGSLLASLAWLLVALVYNATGVWPVEITDRDLVLKRVAPDFVDAVRDDRATHGEDEVLRPHWWAKRRRKPRPRDEDYAD